MNLNDLREKSVTELISIAQEIGLENINKIKKKDLIFKILFKVSEKNEIFGGGVLEILNDGYGFLRSVKGSYQPGPDDIYVSPNQIRKFQLRRGDTIFGLIRPPKDSERFFAILKIQEINFENTNKQEQKIKILFENSTPIFPNERLKLEQENGKESDLTGRLIDLIAPLGKGQRALLVAPPKVGKTMMLKNICHAIEKNNPECYVIVLLVGERPEEVTDMKRSVKGEVVSSTFDEDASRHVHISETVINKAKRLVEHKKDVVILLDSITRLARAYNTIQPSSGKILTGGMDARALEKPKRFFGAARNVEEGGSITIIATALIDTGSKMDEVIYEEFKGTGNMEIHLDRNIADKRIYPAINILRSGTRRDDLLTTQTELQKMWILRKILHQNNNGTNGDGVRATEFLLDKLKKSKTNEEFFKTMNR